MHLEEADTAVVEGDGAAVRGHQERPRVHHAGEVVAQQQQQLAGGRGTKKEGEGGKGAEMGNAANPWGRGKTRSGPLLGPLNDVWGELRISAPTR